MGWLSLRLVRLALFAYSTSLFGYASSAIAQIPAFGPESQSKPAPEPAFRPAPPALPAPAPAAALPPAPAAPVGASAPPAAPNAPAKAHRITAHGAAEAKVEDDERYDEAEDARGETSGWYGWQTLIVDASSITAFMAGLSMTGDGNRGGSTLVWAGALGYELGPGIVHLAHQNPGRGFASIGMRFGLPLAGAFIGLALASGCNRSLCEAGGGGAGILLGMGGAIAIDAALFAYDEPKPSAARGPRLMPLASVTPHQAWVGLGGEL